MENCVNSCVLNLPRAGLGVFAPPQFFCRCLKNGFGTPVYISLSHILWKFQIQVTQGQVTRSRQVASPQKKFWVLVIASPRPDDRPLWNFQRLISVTVSIKYLSRNFDIGYPKSGKFCNFSILSQREKIERRLFWTKTVRNTLKHRFTGRFDTLPRNIATSDP